MKKIGYMLIFLISFFICIFNVNALEEIDLVSPNHVIYDLNDDKIISSNHFDEQINIASLTKIMTTITAINKCNNIQEKVTISDEMLSLVRWDASVAGLKAGDTVTIEDLLYASILPSGADATIALGITLSGTVDSFVEDMNELASEIGMKHSHFVNVTGLDIDNHYSTLEDLLILLKYSLSNELFNTIYQTQEYLLSNGLVVNSTIKLYNRLMNIDTSRIIGSKTGFTNKAGTCISFLFESNGHKYLAITTGAPQVQGYFYNLLDALAIIKYIDTNYNNQLISEGGTIYDEIAVKYSNIEKLDILSNQDIYAYLPNDYDKNMIKVKYDGVSSIDYKTKIGTKLGTLKYYVGDQLIAEEEVTLDKEIKVSIIKFLLKPSSIIIIVIILFLFNLVKIKNTKTKKRKRRVS